MTSFTFNLALQRCYLRVRRDLKPDVLCYAISSSKTLIAHQVVKNENGEEVGIDSIPRFVRVLRASCFRFFFHLVHLRRLLCKMRKRIRQSRWGLESLPYFSFGEGVWYVLREGQPENNLEMILSGRGSVCLHYFSQLKIV